MSLSCPELVNLPRLDNETQDAMMRRINAKVKRLIKLVEVENASGLSYDIVSQWYMNARQEKFTDDPAIEFPRFINAWISFNCWAMAVTDQPDQEREMLAIVSAWPRLNTDFDSYRRGNGDVNRLVHTWPIINMREARLLYKSQENRRTGKENKGREQARRMFRERLSEDGWKIYTDLYKMMIESPDASVNMSEIRHQLFDLLRQKDVLFKYSWLWSPSCFVYHKTWLSHPSEEHNIPMDWPHVLNAVYQVRCNLFHGDKSAHVHRDEEDVVPTVRVFVSFLNRSGYPNY